MNYAEIEWTIEGRIGLTFDKFECLENDEMYTLRFSHSSIKFKNKWKLNLNRRSVKMNEKKYYFLVVLFEYNVLSKLEASSGIYTFLNNRGEDQSHAAHRGETNNNNNNKTQTYIIHKQDDLTYFCWCMRSH